MELLSQKNVPDMIFFFEGKSIKFYQTIEIIQNHSNYISIRLNFQQQQQQKSCITHFHCFPFISFSSNNILLIVLSQTTHNHTSCHITSLCVRQNTEKKTWKFTLKVHVFSCRTSPHICNIPPISLSSAQIWQKTFQKECSLERQCNIMQVQMFFMQC